MADAVIEAVKATTLESNKSLELRHMLKKKQMMVEDGDEGLTAAEQFYALAS